VLLTAENSGVTNCDNSASHVGYNETRDSLFV